MSITLTRQIIKVDKPQVSDSWKMITFTDSSTKYEIDTIQSGMSFTFGCKLPCLTCRPDDPEYCLSCNQYTKEYLILYDGKCNKDCPPQTYQEAYNCLPCDDKCKTCTKYSGSTCTSCHYENPFAEYPFLSGNTCVDECIYGYFGDLKTGKCSTCVDPCETCTSEPDKCLSCRMPEAGEDIVSFFHDFTCKKSCPNGWVANVP